MSNNSVVTRNSLKQKIQNFGYKQVEISQIFTSGYLAGKYICSIENTKKVYAIGMPGLYEELEALGLEIIKGNTHNMNASLEMNQKIFQNIEIDNEISAICVGIDLNFNYYKLCYASLCVDKQNTQFVACDDDAHILVGGKKMPICGAMVRSIAKVSGKEPVICGKPNPFVVNCILQEKKIQKEECIMIGDSIESDVGLAKNAGIDSLILLSGITSENDILLSETKGDIKSLPTYYSEFL